MSEKKAVNLMTTGKDQEATFDGLVTFEPQHEITIEVQITNDEIVTFLEQYYNEYHKVDEMPSFNELSEEDIAHLSKSYSFQSFKVMMAGTKLVESIKKSLTEE